MRHVFFLLLSEARGPGLYSMTNGRNSTNLMKIWDKNYSFLVMNNKLMFEYVHLFALQICFFFQLSPMESAFLLVASEGNCALIFSADFSILVAFWWLKNNRLMIKICNGSSSTLQTRPKRKIKMKRRTKWGVYSKNSKPSSLRKKKTKH